MDIFRDNMENSTANILLDGLHLPDLLDCDILTASENFFHMDRTADFNVLICVTDGAMYVTEDGRDYEIPAGGLLFLRSGLRHYGRRETPRGTRWFYAHFRLPGPPHDMPHDAPHGTPADAFLRAASQTTWAKEAILRTCAPPL